MASIGEFKPYLNEIARNLRILAKNSCGETSELAPTAATSAADNPVTIPAGYSNLVVTQTNGTGTVDITFPNGDVYTMSTDAEVFVITGQPLGEFTIEGIGGATFKYYAY